MENYELSVDNSIHGWLVAKKCNDCKLIVFVHNAKEEQKSINIVERKFAEEHPECSVTKTLLDVVAI